MATQSEKESTRTSERSGGSYGSSGSRESNVGQSGGAREQGSAGGSSYGGTFPAEGGGTSGQAAREYGTRSGRESGGGYESGSSGQGARQYGNRASYEQGYGGAMSGSRYGGQVQDWAQKAEQAIHPLEEYAREKPLMSLLMAAGVGALVGMLFLRR